MTKEFDDLAAALEELGEPAVRVRLAHGSWSERTKRFVEEWLRSKEAQRESEAASKRDSREAESISIAREALAAAKRANRIAWIATAITAAFMIKEIIVAVFT